MNSIIEKAEELGMAILNSEEYKAFSEAQDKLDANPEAQKLIQAFQNKQSSLHQAHHSGQEIQQEEVDELKDLQKDMLGNEIIKDYVVAKQKTEKLITSVNQVLSRTVGESLGIGGSSGGCSGGCC
ncbi:MAG: YlbF family regulator [Candidatus Syntrophonatronum acetioxidans]|uniref:YlbF family regulator n=1 Tax=Candidatus Syntrophonatronum acetioxidans TaxID=1795816 RepID=A0A424YF52_9FIRM|nr:MAG: YlbF family regulator [Candidatus Syntrophonatronum acetioxidans]